MNDTYLQKLEYNKIKEKLSNYCKTYIGKNYVSNLMPSNNKEEVQNWLNQTNEAVSVLYKASSAPLQEIENITQYLKILESGGTLSLKAILDLTQILNVANNLKNYFSQDFINKEDYPILLNLFSMLYINKELTDKVFKIIIDENTIADDASSNLKDIRRNINSQEQRIKAALNNILHNNSKYIQENIVTIRNDRYVIPVKEEARSQIKGLIHDISSTGATVFIEPLSVFDLNNELNNLKIEEKLEIERIISELSNLFIPYTEELANNTDTIGFLDFIFAKAKYSKELKATCPKINNEKYFNLKNVKHPLLNQEKAVPINVYAGNNYFSCLIITGPNTGGKTVTLKTVGLIHLMACSGLNIPADEGSSIYIFDNIFADIGDDQSIADSLSTFSSHMLNIVDIIKNATSNSLILVDELGSGTDPLEGANLAISILEYFKNLGSITIATTHYQELKKYALSNKDFENASVEFNIDTLSPTYKLLIGIPGKSNAFEISKKLGLNNEIISRAKSLLNSEDVKFETILKEIYDNKVQIEHEKEDISKKLNEVEQLRLNLSKQDEEKTKKANEIINNAKQDARRILIEAKEEVSEAIRKVNDTTSSKDLNNIRNNLNRQIKETTPVVNAETIKKLQESFKMPPAKATVSYNVSKTRTINSEINVIGQNVLDATMLIDKFLDDCSLAKLQTVRIVHGKGTGKLKNGIHEFLKNNPHVKNYRIGTFGEGEMGVTVVELK